MKVGQRSWRMCITENEPRQAQQISRYMFFPVIFFETIIVNVQNIVKRKDNIGYRLIICPLHVIACDIHVNYSQFGAYVKLGTGLILHQAE